MKKLLLLLIASSLFFETFAQSASKIWIGIDGAYWQKSIIGGVSNDFRSEYSSSIRPMLGYQLNEKWSIGMMANFQDYRLDQGISSFQFNRSQGELPIPPPQIYNQATKNTIYGIGAFIRRELALSEKISFNFSLYTMRESGNKGTLEQYHQIISCPNCATVANPRGRTFSEVNWKTGLDIGFAYQANNWLHLELRANLIELRLQKISDPNLDLTNIAPNPIISLFQSSYGNFTDFGSAVRRDGIRFGLVFTPF